MGGVSKEAASNFLGLSCPIQILSCCLMRYYMTNKHLRRCQLVFCSCSFVCSSNVRVNEKLKSHFVVARKTVATECFENLTAKQTRLKSIHQKNSRLWFAFYLNSIKWVYDYNKLGWLWLLIKIFPVLYSSATAWLLWFAWLVPSYHLLLIRWA